MSEFSHGERLRVPESVSLDRQHFTRVLTNQVLPYLPPTIPRENDGKLAVLSVGCGFGYDAKPIIDTIPDSTYLGIDTAKRSIDYANMFNPDLMQDPNIRFELQNIHDLDAKQFGIVVLRHPPVYGFRKELAARGESVGWEPELNASLTHLRDEGLLFITTEDKHFYNGLVSYVVKKELVILSQGENLATVEQLSSQHDQFSITAQKRMG